MAFDNTIWVSVYVLVGLFILYKVLFRKNPFHAEYKEAYHDVLTSDKYKVKGQYDKEK